MLCWEKYMIKSVDVIVKKWLYKLSMEKINVLD